MNIKTIFFILILSTLFSCQSLVKTAEREELDQTHTQQPPPLERSTISASANSTPYSRFKDKDLEKYAYELGLDPQKGLSPEEKNAVYQRRKVRELERSLNSEKERLQYSKILPLLEKDEEKVQILSIDSIEGRQAWINRNKIWSRLKSNQNYSELVENQDIAIGMSSDLVKRSWGEPDSIDISGHEVYKNERWKYTRDVPTPNGYKRERRFVYFEGGRVVGWETE